MSGSTFHVAAEPDGLTQKCSRCGVVIIDYEGTMIVGTDRSPAFFPANRLVQQDGDNWLAGALAATGTEIRNGLCELPRHTPVVH